MTRVAAAVGANMVGVIGAGYVGLTTAACLSHLGHYVRCADISPLLIQELQLGRVAMVEPGLEQLVQDGIGQGRLSFTVDTRAAVTDAQTVFLCLPTPSGPDGSADISALESVVSGIADRLRPGCVVVIKSTAPPGTAAKMASLILRDDIPLAVNPEFLREGHAVEDFLNPQRIVVGADSPTIGQLVGDMYARLSAPLILTSTTSAELAKYAANCFLATKLSYVNEIAELCECVGADITEVTSVLASDSRIGEGYLRPGPGWGGPCLPKDIRALLHVSSANGHESRLLHAALTANEDQHRRVADKVRRSVSGDLAGARVALLGLTFKADISDVRESPALAVAALLAAEQAVVTAYDPYVRENLPHVTLAADPYAAMRMADAVLVMTEWPQFQHLDWHRARAAMRGDTVIDARNHLRAPALHAAGLRWHGLGKPLSNAHAGCAHVRESRAASRGLAGTSQLTASGSLTAPED